MYYVVASKWPSGNLCIYAYGQEIQHGDAQSAKDFLAYVQRVDTTQDWAIYEVTFSKVEE